MPTISVGIPTMGNRGNLLRESIMGVLRQTVTDIEVFVSDNGTADSTAAVVDSFRDPRLRYVKVPTPGLHANLNHALRVGTAPFVAICQDDDYWFPDNLERLLAAIEQSEDIGVAHGAFDLVDEQGSVLRRGAAWSGWKENTVESGPTFLRRSMGTVNPINMSSALFRRSAAESESFRTQDDVLCDTGMWMRLAQRWAVAFVGETLSVLRVHPDAISVATGINDAQRHTTMYEIELAQRVKTSFLAESGTDPPERRELRRLSRRWAQHELLNIVVRETSPERPPLDTIKGLRAAADIEPSLLRLPRTYRIMLASLAGRRGRGMVRRLLGLPPTPAPPR